MGNLNKQGVVVGEGGSWVEKGELGINWGHFYLLWSQWRKVIKICLCTNEVVIYVKEKSAEEMWKQYFQKQCFHVIYTFYLHYFTFLAITFQTYNNIGLKTKALFTICEKFQNLEFRSENIAFLRKN